MSASQPHLRPVPHESGSTMHLSLSVSDPEVIAALQEHTEPHARERFALTALRIGVLAMRQASGMIDADAIKREGSNLVKELRQSVENHRVEVEKNVKSALEGFLHPEDGHFARRVRRLTNREDGELTKLIEEQLTGDNSALARQLTKQMGDESPLLKMLDPDNKQGVLALIEGQVKSLLDQQREAVLGEFSTDSEDSALSRLIKRVSELQQATTDQLSLDKDGSALQRLKAELDTAQERIRKQLSLDEEGSALKQIQKTIDERLEKLLKDQGEFQTQIAERVAELTARKQERAASTLHGGDFEDELQAALASFNGSDILSRVGESTGLIANSKVGDFVIEMDAESAFVGRKVVIEAKQDQSYKLVSKALEETDTAIKNRGADVGVFVMSARSLRELEQSGKSHDWNRTLVRHGKRILVVWDPDSDESLPILSAAISLAKALLSEPSQTETEEFEIDFEIVDKAILDIEKQVERFDTIKGFCGNITRDAGKIEDEMKKIAKNLERDALRLRKQVEAIKP